MADTLVAFCGFRREGPLFLGRKRNVNGGRIGGDLVNRVVYAVGEAAGLPHLHAHALRHFFATATLRQSGSLEFTRSQLRHSSLRITQVYLDLFLEDGGRYVEDLDRLLVDPLGSVRNPNGLTGVRAAP
jgi:integrase